MDMTHDAVRAALAGDGAIPTAAREHLASCEECTAFARGLDRVRRAAPLLVPAGPPEGLADRIVGALPATPPAPAPAIVPFRRRALHRVAFAAAATLVIGATAAVVTRDGERSPQMTLAAAARKTEESRTAKVRVTGTATFTLPAGERRPAFETLPTEIQARVEQQWQKVYDAWQAALDRIQDTIEDLPIPSIPGLPGIPRPSIPRPPRSTSPPLPRSLTTTVNVDATGDVVFDDRIRLNGTVGVDTESSFAMVSAKQGVAVRAGGRWSVAQDALGPWAALVGSPDALLRLVTEATDVVPVSETGYRFRTSTPDGTLVNGEATVRTGRLTSVRVLAEGRTGGPVGAAWRTDLRVEISAPGAHVAPAPVDVASVETAVRAPSVASRVIYPFGEGLR